jgi:thiosulfate/3-mercaptopyruvate sulfurtransferase
MRSSVTFLCLYNAGYRNLKMYDGAYLEWSASGQNPVDLPDGVNISTSANDNS